MSATDDHRPENHVELDPDHPDPVVRSCNRVIRHGVRVMAVVMLW